MDLKFDDKGLIPAIIQDDKTDKVLTLCYMNKDAIEKSFVDGKVWVFRRSAGKLMVKGGTSGCFQTIKGVCVDCENNSLLFKVDQENNILLVAGSIPGPPGGLVLVRQARTAR